MHSALWQPGIECRAVQEMVSCAELAVVMARCGCFTVVALVVQTC
jgi:hypothetical protein